MSSESSSTLNDEEIKKTVLKLLDKAGHDKRLTPRILREKAEQRLNLTSGDLKVKREDIKVIICDWFHKRRAAETERDTATLKALVRLARVSGNIPQMMKGITELSTKEQIKAFRERLRAKGLEFSDTPTEAEIAAIDKAHQLKKDLDGIDPSLIVNTSRTGKRPLESGASSSGAKAVKTEVKSEPGVSIKSEPSIKTEPSTSSSTTSKTEEGTSVGVVVKKERVKAEYSDEEAEF